MKRQKNQVVAGNDAVTNIKYGNVRMSNAVNAPKNNSIASDCIAITDLVANVSYVPGLTVFGHKENCKGGVIDQTILSGNVHTIESFINSLLCSGLKVVENDKAKFASDTLKAVLAKRVVDHIKWCSNTANNAHGGYGSRLAKTGIYHLHSELAGYLESLATRLSNEFSGEYSSLYKNRNKTGLKQ